MNARMAIAWRSMASGRDTGPLALLLRALFLLPSLGYALVQRVRTWLYRSGVLAHCRLPRPVISIGNLTVGGTGKTPLTALVAGMLMANGMRVAVLTRGYGGSREGQTAIVSDGSSILLTADECGDEPRLLAGLVPGLMVVMGSDRHAAGLLALETLRPDIFILDDGYQHLRLQRDLNILLLDHARPFGNGLCLPAGMLREPAGAAERADLVIHTRCPAGVSEATVVPRFEVPECCARYVLTDLEPLRGGTASSYGDIAAVRVMACAGIAEPDSFFDGLRQRGVHLVATVPLGDHAEYGPQTVAALEVTFRDSGADLLLTTAKDGVKMAHVPESLAAKTMVCRLVLILNDPKPLETALRNLLQK